MARSVSPSVAVFLFLLTLTLSRARDLPNPFSESESEPEPEPKSQPELIHHPEPKTVSFTIDPIPLTLLRFRPINRHFQPGRPLPLSLRTGKRRCRHGHRREIPYGNDAILLRGDADASASRIHPRWVTVHSAAEMRLPATTTTVERLDSDREYYHHGENHHDHHHDHHHDDDHDHHHHHKKSWFAKKIRKFMNLF